MAKIEMHFIWRKIFDPEIGFNSMIFMWKEMNFLFYSFAICSIDFTYFKNENII